MKLATRRSMNTNAKNQMEETCHLACFANNDNDWLLLQQLFEKALAQIKTLKKGDRRLNVQLTLTTAPPKMVPIPSSEERTAAIKAEELKALTAQQVALKKQADELEKPKKQKLAKDEQHAKELEQQAITAEIERLERLLKERK